MIGIMWDMVEKEGGGSGVGGMEGGDVEEGGLSRALDMLLSEWEKSGMVGSGVAGSGVEFRDALVAILRDLNAPPALVFLPELSERRRWDHSLRSGAKLLLASETATDPVSAYAYLAQCRRVLHDLLLRLHKATTTTASTQHHIPGLDEREDDMDEHLISSKIMSMEEELETSPASPATAYRHTIDQAVVNELQVYSNEALVSKEQAKHTRLKPLIKGETEVMGKPGKSVQFADHKLDHTASDDVTICSAETEYESTEGVDTALDRESITHLQLRLKRYEMRKAKGRHELPMPDHELGRNEDSGPPPTAPLSPVPPDRRSGCYWSRTVDMELKPMIRVRRLRAFGLRLAGTTGQTGGTSQMSGRGRQEAKPFRLTWTSGRGVLDLVSGDGGRGDKGVAYREDPALSLDEEEWSETTRENKTGGTGGLALGVSLSALPDPNSLAFLRSLRSPSVDSPGRSSRPLNLVSLFAAEKEEIKPLRLPKPFILHKFPISSYPT